MDYVVFITGEDKKIHHYGNVSANSFQEAKHKIRNTPALARMRNKIYLVRADNFLRIGD
jgi:hypothetical protein